MKITKDENPDQTNQDMKNELLNYHKDFNMTSPFPGISLFKNTIWEVNDQTIPRPE